MSRLIAKKERENHGRDTFRDSCISLTRLKMDTAGLEAQEKKSGKGRSIYHVKMVAKVASIK